MEHCHRSFHSLKNAVTAGIFILAACVALVGGTSAILEESSCDVDCERALAEPVKNQTLILTQVVFRHGNRTAEGPSYPNDRYANFQYPPYGRGQLISAGKKLAYEGGQFLRKRYGKFLGDVLTPEIMSLKSSNTPRTHMTAILVSAGLWPPTKAQQWGEGLGTLFQPPYVETIRDPYFWGLVFDGSCPAFNQEYKRLLQTKEVKNILQKFEGFRKELSQVLGMNVNGTEDALRAHLALTSQKEYGLELPKWYTKKFEEKLHSYASWTFAFIGYTEKLQRIRGGLILKDILSTFTAAATNSLKPAGRKIFLYSAHDITVSILLQAFKLYEVQTPPYGSMVIMELHSIPSVNKPKSVSQVEDGLEDKEIEVTDVLDKLDLEMFDKDPLSYDVIADSLRNYGIKLFLRNSSFHDPYPLTMPQCSHICPLDKFASLLAKLIPKGTTAECK